ncbi:MAG: hypothetical protein WEB52_09315 [Dehalococcoidia bacterium]
MADKDLEELQDPESWEFDEEDAAVPPRKARAVVSVAFPREDFDRVEEFAEQHGLKVSALIRQAAVAFVSGAQGATSTIAVLSAGGPERMVAYIAQTPQATRASASSFEQIPA